MLLALLLILALIAFGFGFAVKALFWVAVALVVLAVVSALTGNGPRY